MEATWRMWVVFSIKKCILFKELSPHSVRTCFGCNRHHLASCLPQNVTTLYVIRVITQNLRGLLCHDLPYVMILAIVQSCVRESHLLIVLFVDYSCHLQIRCLGKHGNTNVCSICRPNQRQIRGEAHYLL